MWEWAEKLIKKVGPVIAIPIIKWAFGGGGKDQADQALSAQTDIADQQLMMQRQQFGQDLPFRTDLFGALRGRQLQQFPQVLPQQPTYQNPMSNRNMMKTLPGRGPEAMRAMAAPEGSLPREQHRYNQSLKQPGASRGGFNAMPNLSDALRQQRKPQADIMQVLSRLLQQQQQRTG